MMMMLSRRQVGNNSDDQALMGMMWSMKDPMTN